MAKNGTARQRRGCVPSCLGFVVVVVVIVAAIIGDQYRDDDRPARTAPRSGSSADVMCDTNETGPDTVTLGGKRYDATCVAGFPWNDQFNDQ